jgi:hypothetical protein
MRSTTSGGVATNGARGGGADCGKSIGEATAIVTTVASTRSIAELYRAMHTG